jgi:hypothetical protein
MLPEGVKSLVEIAKYPEARDRVVHSAVLLEYLLKSITPNGGWKTLDTLVQEHTDKFSEPRLVDEARLVRNKLAHASPRVNRAQVMHADVSLERAIEDILSRPECPESVVKNVKCSAQQEKQGVPPPESPILSIPTPPITAPAPLGDTSKGSLKTPGFAPLVPPVKQFTPKARDSGFEKTDPPPEINPAVFFPKELSRLLGISSDQLFKIATRQGELGKDTFRFWGDLGSTVDSSVIDLDRIPDFLLRNVYKIKEQLHDQHELRVVREAIAKRINGLLKASWLKFIGPRRAFRTPLEKTAWTDASAKESHPPTSCKQESCGKDIQALNPPDAVIEELKERVSLFLDSLNSWRMFAVPFLELPALAQQAVEAHRAQLDQFSARLQPGIDPDEASKELKIITRKVAQFALYETENMPRQSYLNLPLGLALRKLLSTAGLRLIDPKRGECGDPYSEVIHRVVGSKRSSSQGLRGRVANLVRLGLITCDGCVIYKAEVELYD